MSAWPLSLCIPAALLPSPPPSSSLHPHTPILLSFKARHQMAAPAGRNFFLLGAPTALFHLVLQLCAYCFMFSTKLWAFLGQDWNSFISDPFVLVSASRCHSEAAKMVGNIYSTHRGGVLWRKASFGSSLTSSPGLVPPLLYSLVFDSVLSFHNSSVWNKTPSSIPGTQ